jgi:hypothetical protein
MFELLHRVTGCLRQDAQQGLLLGKDFTPLDLDFYGLPLTSGRNAGLLQHGCTHKTKPMSTVAK